MTNNRRQVPIDQLKERMVLAEPIYDEEGKILYSKGLRLNGNRIQRIKKLNKHDVLIEVEEILPYNTNAIIKTSNKINEDEVVDKQAQMKQILIEETKAEAVEIVEEAFEKVLKDGSVKSEKIKMIVDKIIEIILSDSKLVLNLSSLNAMDNYLLSHSVNVCVLSLMTGVVLGFNQAKLLKLGSGALIHDIGKILVDQDILNAPRKLTDQEFSLVKQHTSYGYKILKDSFKYDEETACIALSHHERMDGSGYPNKLNRTQIPMFAKIVGIVDVFDAMTTDKVYSDGATYYEGISHLVSEGRKSFDEDILKKFIMVIGHYPLGTHVRLSTGDLGLVTKLHPFMPVVKVIEDKNGQPLSNYYEIDLHKNPSVSIIDVIFKALSN